MDFKYQRMDLQVPLYLTYKFIDLNSLNALRYDVNSKYCTVYVRY